MLAEDAAMQIAGAGNAQLVEMLPQELGIRPIGLRLLVRAAEHGDRSTSSSG